MSRFRSHLDSMVAGSRTASGPAPAYPQPQPAYPAPQSAAHHPAQAGPDLGSIHRSLDELAARISAIPRSAPQQPDNGRNTQAVLQEVRREFSQGIEQLRGELNHSRAELSGSLNNDLRRIADGIAALQNSQSMHPDYVDQMQAELRNLNSGLQQISDWQSRMPHSQVDLSGVSRSIESGYSEIVNKLDQVLSQRGSELPPLPEIEIPDYSVEFRTLQQRLEEVARAVVSMSVSPPGQVDQHALERIEARLTSLAKTVDRFQEQGTASHGHPGDETAAYQETVAAELARIAGRLEAIESGAASAPSVLTDIQGIAGRIDQLQADLGVVAQSLGNLESGELDVDARLAMSPQAGFELAGHFEALESRIAELAARMDTASIGGSDQPNTGGQEILSVLRDLVARVESIEAIARETGNGEQDLHAAGTMDTRFASLENQLSAIASQLGSVTSGSAGAIDMQPIAERLDHIEGQLAASRDIVIDIATEAARKAAGSSSAIAGPQIDELLAEIRQIRDSGTHGGPEAVTLGEISEAVRDIASRLAVIEEMAADARHDAHAMPAHAATPLPDVALPEIENAPSMADAVYPDTAQPARAVAPDRTTMREPEVEDVPLAPGSGMPDLEALVRRASNRKRGSEEVRPREAADHDGIGDLMAAARRAAQAASAQAESNRARQESKTDRASLLGRLSGAKPSLPGRKPLLLSAAVIAVALAGWYVVPKFFGGTPQAEISRAVDQGSLSTVPEADDGMNVGDGAIAGEGMADEDLAADTGDVEPEPMVESLDSDEPETGGGTARETAALPDTGMQAATGSDTPPQAASVASAKLEGLPDGLANAALAADAAAGDGNALFEIGRRLTDGEGSGRDLAKAAEWYRKAAEAGHGPAQYRLGNFYEKGHGVAADMEKAADWYAQAAASGNALAMHNLAVLNVRGLLGSDPDMETAIGWFEKAANLGVKDSQVNLGILYTQGMGVEADVEQAYKWFSVAAKGGDNDAAEKRDMVAKIMRPEQLERARGEAELWKPQALDRAANTPEVKEGWKGAEPAGQVNLSQTETVRQVQAVLGALGYDAGPAGGIFGGRTETAIRQFQERNGLTVNGQITPELVDALGRQSI